ncbi:MAG: TOBE domain-containing protein, partial [Vulcanimicrobiaceae bacterium]
EHIELHSSRLPVLDRNVFEGVVRSRTFGGKFVEYDVEIGGVAMRLQRLAGEEFAPGDIVRIHLPPDRSRVVLADDDRARV